MDLRESVGERRHPWEVARSGFFRRAVRRWAPGAQTVIDVGAGDSWFATELIADLPPAATVTCWDAEYTADDLATSLPAAVRRTAGRPGHPAALVLALDVLEHIEDDRSFVRDQLAPLVEPGGTLVVSVPAHQWLYTSHDRALGHHRRHSSRSLRALLSPHFRIVAHGSLFMSLLPPRALAKALEALQRGERAPQVSSTWSHGAALTSIVLAVLRLDALLCRIFAALPLQPPGLSVWAVATPLEAPAPAA